MGWVPVAAVAAMTLFACAAAALLPERVALKRSWLAAAIVCGGIALAATVWQGRHQAVALDSVVEQLQGTWRRLDRIGLTLPAVPGPGANASFDSVRGGFAALADKAYRLDRQIDALRHEKLGRTIDDKTAAAMIAYLRPFGRHRVVVSCVPNDVEAYDYSNRIVTILREAGWDAVGPETTTIFGAEPAMGINLYVRGGQAPQAADLLLKAFVRFNIPYESRVASNDAIPDNDTVELFVGKKP